ncbi:c-type cytochrome [Parasphingorhabdus halotolerans]|uniref:Cytochrome c family protein n=1 Tax=Parasphingorhabdus halotolerans TaxID=2725558 RepID=A0A6H2DR68_9SPHN|nr:cytochrome c family protein [Parasphingorhabdus halotolerans]QJB70445.1 cytochrome c family protein [Parasphingorhabdus halotolerans]
MIRADFKTHLRTIATLIAASALASACSGGGSDSSDTGGSTTESAAAEATAEAAPVTFASLTGDPAKGKMAFAQCRTCHVTDPGVNMVGPSLAGIVGATAGSIKGYKYSPANASSGITWTEEQLFEYLADPQAVIPKTKMIFAGMPDAQQRADVIAYLKNPN